jgi:G3E family GTPase
MIVTSDRLQIGVIVNDMADVNIDAELVKQAGNISEVREQLVELSNGCICCTLREDLLRSLLDVAASRRVDYVVVEGSGISEPLPVAETFTFVEPTTKRCLAQYARLDTLVTVVDGPAFLKDFECEDFLSTRGMATGPTDERKLSHLLADQIEFANVVLLNKCDRLSDSDRQLLHTLLARMNPDARIIDTINSGVDLPLILNTKLFSMEKAEANPLWLREARYAEHVPESIEFVT